ncbi:hypothetical protein [Rhodovulum visakhapatnamense]|nr:hypothetical protein [Rhodovulum visakhapatnamense]
MAAAGLCLLGPVPALTQGTDGGRLAELRFSQQLERDDGVSSTTTGLGVSLASRTRSSHLEFSADGGLEHDFNDSSPSSVQDPRVILSYGRESRSSALDLSFSYREDDVDSDFTEEDLDGRVLNFGDGTRRSMSTDLSLVTGRDAVFGTSLDLGYDSLTYSGTNDPSLIDEETRRAALALRFQLDPQLSTELRATFRDRDRADQGTDTRYESFGVSADYAISEALSTSLYVGHSRTTEDGITGESTEKGFTYDLSVILDRPNGTLTGSLSSDIDEAGQRTTARLTRSMDLPTGALTAGAGLSSSQGDSLRPLVSLAYSKDLPRGSLGASAEQAFTTDSDGDEVLNSRFSLSYRHSLTPLSSFQAGLGLSQTDYISADSEDGDRLWLDLSYRHNLAADWDIVSGYSHSLSKKGDADREYSNKVYISLEKSIQWRF